MVGILIAVHVLAAAFWVGATLTLIFVVAAVRRTEFAAAFMQNLMVGSRLALALGISGAVTILSGLWALWIVSGGFNPAFMRSTTGILIGCGAACGILAIGTGIAAGRSQQRAAPFAAATSALLVAALLCMVIGAHA
jgi:putative copper export protein